MLKEGEIQNIRYTKANADSGTMDRFEVTERVIIPTFIPKPNIKAIDVTDLSEEDRIQLQDMLKEYNQYVKDCSKTTFSFDKWAEHSKNTDISNVKYRTFKLDSTEIL